MMRLCFVVLTCVGVAAACASDREMLKREQDPERLEAAAIAIVSSNDPAAIADLGMHLRQAAFLSRLDPPNESVDSVVRLGRVFGALRQHPSPAAAALCVELVRDPTFAAVPARINPALGALAAVRPMTETAAEIFRQTSHSGYLEVNGPLLANNASPQALKVLSEVLADDSLDAAQRASVAHWGLLPNRLNPAVVAMCAQLLKQRGFSSAVEMAIMESVFTYKPRLWFGVSASQPTAPPWKAATPAAREALQSLAEICLARNDLPADLRAAVKAVLEQFH